MAQSSHRGFVWAAASSSSGPCANKFSDGVAVAVDGINVPVNDVDSAPPAPAAPIDVGPADTTRTKKVLPTEDTSQATFLSEVTPTPMSPPPPTQEVEVPPPVEAPAAVKTAATRRRSPTMRFPSPAVRKTQPRRGGTSQAHNLRTL